MFCFMQTLCICMKWEVLLQVMWSFLCKQLFQQDWLLCLTVTSAESQRALHVSFTRKILFKCAQSIRGTTYRWMNSHQLPFQHFLFLRAGFPNRRSKYRLFMSITLTLCDCFSWMRSRYATLESTTHVHALNPTKKKSTSLKGLKLCCEGQATGGYNPRKGRKVAGCEGAGSRNKWPIFSFAPLWCP